MAPPPPLDLSIPNTTLHTPTDTSTSTDKKPYTLYNITLRLPLRTTVLQKRYSDFLALDTALKSQAGNVAPPIPLPGKTWSWFTSTNASPELTERRREGLEKYLRGIAGAEDRRWRETKAWRAFLNLPGGAESGGRGHDALAATGAGTVAAAADPSTWLDLHRDLKAQLHDARLQLGRRDNATTAQAQHEASANAKRSLVRAGGLIATLEEGLRAMSGSGGASSSGGSGAGLGEGELRRRRDLLGSARVEREGLEKLLVSLAVKSTHAHAQSPSGTSTPLSTASYSGTATPSSQQPPTSSSLFGPHVSRPPASGRVLGGPPIPETAKTRELSNEGVLQLQQQMMADQDLDVEELAKIVRRQREMGEAINEELVLQNEMLKRVDEDVDRVQGKVNVARKRVGKIK